MGTLNVEVKIMKVKDIMSEDITCLTADDSITKAAQIMKDLNVGSIPICRQNKVIGIITDRDITLRSVATGIDLSQQKVSDIMTPSPILGNPSMDIDDAVSIMSHRQVRRLPIVENDTLVGMVSLGDISTDSRLQHDAEQALSNISQPSGTPM
jgi:CBS domain-containing protein